ncbi:NADPH-dependent FMN reductase [Enterococcus saccharolyticus]|uniref:Oxidoreductase n=1 Tax=Enterococcus saccharolyticus subsp. saccharolyticus ATCC 43076 TaxID=1139996 RepID=S0NJZ0_9ENTE|nr:NADPH-dependent FMN reductase [Enterococcus saccharolyticus]EOT28220.1 oxidoreductase [Enterococcus saccharolyticus subsp. saccharolyticus ATCC 43076]EOT81574.1 oxidoreductase [Enterococcus saccharolyticus subsp. saccharolyticus ATCC 43076]
MVKLIGLVGTNSEHSTNRQLLQFMSKHFADQAEIDVVEIKEIPIFNKPTEIRVPEIVQQLADKIEAADGVIISTPEYDHAVPASLMNVLSWLSYGIYPFVDKPVMITGASYGTLGSSRAQMHLRQILDAPELKARIMPSSEFLLSHSLQAFDNDNCLKDSEQVAQLEGLFTDFLVFVELMKQLNHAHEMNKKAAENFSWEEV